METQARDEFVAFFDAAERRLRFALTGAFGVEAGRDAAADALVWGWQHWDSLREMENPVGYLYRVGRTAGLRAVSLDPAAPTETIEAHIASMYVAWEVPDFEPNLAKFLAGLSEQQRVALWMVHGLGFTHQEVAELLECSRPTVGTHVQRALAKLRRHLGVNHG